MAYPTSLDSFTTKTDNVDDVLAAHVNALQVAVAALEAKLGIDSSAVNTSIDYFLKNSGGAFRTHTHDGSSDDGALLDWDTCWTDAIHDHSSAAEGGSIGDFKSGDWIISSVTTARTGWTNVSTTYTGKFIRIGTSPLTTGGSDTHTTPSHVLTSSEIPSINSTNGAILPGNSGVPTGLMSAGGNINSGTTTVSIALIGGGGGHTHPSADNVPAYVQTTIFQKN